MSIESLSTNPVILADVFSGGPHMRGITRSLYCASTPVTSGNTVINVPYRVFAGTIEPYTPGNFIAGSISLQYLSNSHSIRFKIVVTISGIVNETTLISGINECNNVIFVSLSTPPLEGSQTVTVDVLQETAGILTFNTSTPFSMSLNEITV